MKNETFFAVQLFLVCIVAVILASAIDSLDHRVAALEAARGDTP